MGQNAGFFFLKGTFAHFLLAPSLCFFGFIVPEKVPAIKMGLVPQSMGDIRRIQELALV